MESFGFKTTFYPAQRNELDHFEDFSKIVINIKFCNNLTSFQEKV